MTPWADDIPDDVRRQWDRLFPDAQRLVRRVMRLTGRLTPVAHTVATNDTVGQAPIVQADNLDMIYNFLRPGAEGLSSLLVAADASLHRQWSGRSDCVAFFLEHRNGFAVTRLLPYRRIPVPFCRASFRDMVTIPAAPPHRLWPAH